MKLNKRECRKCFDPGLTIAASNGLLYAKQVQYIVRTAMKNIGGSRLLVLYIYSREQAVERDFRPAFTVFQGKDDFATLARRENGSFAWHTASLDYMNREYDFDRKCTFYSIRDEERVTRFCAITEKTGFLALNILQSRIKCAQELERRHRKQRITVERMRSLAPLPRDFKGWLHREVLLHYIFYNYQQGKTQMDGYCTACKHEVKVSGPKHNVESVCPRCKKPVTLKSRGKRGYINDRCTAQVIQKISNNELIVRVYKVYCYYNKMDVPELSIYEATRIFVRSDGTRQCTVEPFHHSFNSGDLTPWKNGYCPVFYVYQENFNAEVCGYLYHRNLDEVLSETPWQYSQLKPFYMKEKTQMTTATYLKALIQHPKLEVLFKLGFYNLTCDFLYRTSPTHILDCSKKKPHEILRVWPEDVNDLRDNECRTGELEMYQKYRKNSISSKAREEIFGWLSRYNLRNDDEVLALMSYMTLHKLFRYAEEQFALLSSSKTARGGVRYESMSRVLNEYRDYLRMCNQQNYDMKNSFVLFPKNLQRSHDKVSDTIKAKLTEEQAERFLEFYRQAKESLAFEKDGMLITFPKTPKEIVAEGNTLHHCVGSYVSRVADGECLIVFLRHASKEKKAFYTIEVQGNKIKQVRGMQNCQPTEAVDAFVTMWKKEVLHRQIQLPTAA